MLNPIFLDKYVKYFKMSSAELSVKYLFGFLSEENGEEIKCCEAGLPKPMQP